MNKLALFAGFIGLPLLAAGLAFTAGFLLGAVAAAPKPGRRLVLAGACYVLSIALLVPSIYALYAGHAVYGWFPVSSDGVSVSMVAGAVVAVVIWGVSLYVGFYAGGIVMPIRAELSSSRQKDARHVPPVTEAAIAPSVT